MKQEKATIHTLAKLAGVSAMTVSRVSNHPETVSPETREKIMRIASEHGVQFQPNRLASALRSGKSHMLGVLWSLTKFWIAGNAIKAISHCDKIKDYVTCIMDSHGDQDIVYRQLCNLVSRRVDGVILHDWNLSLISPKNSELLEQIGNVVIITESYREIGFDRIIIDWQPGTVEVMRFLVRANRKKILLYQELDSEQFRLQAHAALHAVGLPQFEAVLNLPPEVKDSSRATLDFLLRTYHTGFPYDAIFCRHENYPVLLEFLKILNLRTPEDVLVIPTLDDFLLEQKMLKMPVLRRVEHEAGQLAVDMLWERINNQGMPVSCHRLAMPVLYET